MNDDDRFLSSRFWQWHVEHEQLEPGRNQEQRNEALALGVLVASIEAGEITSFDGVNSPLARQIKAHHQHEAFEMNSNWIGTSQNWSCPSCSRSKFQISRLGRKNQILAKLVIHHDHMGEALEAAFNEAFKKAGTTVEQVEGQRLVERMGGAFAAYEEVLVCEDCNNADAEAKKLVKSPRYFSFSIGQIRQFIEAGEHRPHQVDGALAARLWNEAKPAYELRMKLIWVVARAAATDTHWYEPFPRAAKPIPAFGYSQRIGDSAVRQWVSSEALYKALGPWKVSAARNLSRWRTTNPKPGQSLPANFLALLRSEETRARAWNSVPDNWHCPICRRSKHQTVYIGDKGKISFYLKTHNDRIHWGSARTICNHCASTLMSLKQEVSGLIGRTPFSSYGLVSPEELSKIIEPHAHSAHSVRAAAAQALVKAVTQKLARNQGEA